MHAKLAHHTHRQGAIQNERCNAQVHGTVHRFGNILDLLGSGVGVGGASAASTGVVDSEGAVVEAGGTCDAHGDSAVEGRFQEELVAEGLVVRHLLPCSSTHLHARNLT